VDYFKRMRV
jgi:hypothetical protein